MFRTIFIGIIIGVLYIPAVQAGDYSHYRGYHSNGRYYDEYRRRQYKDLGLAVGAYGVLRLIDKATTTPDVYIIEQNGYQSSYERGRLDRQRAAQRAGEERAYLCGRTGKC